MIIKKIVNNNIVLSVREDGREVVLMGKGLGFGKKKGQVIEENQIEKVFVGALDQNTDKLIQILKEIPLESIDAADLIISHAKTILGDELNDTIYLSVIDHIHCAIERLRCDAMLSNPLLWEIKTYYPKEYKAGLEGIALLKKKMGIKFPVDEAGFLALHFITSEYGTHMTDTIDIPKMISSMVSIVEEHFHTAVDKSSIHFERFITHMKFFIARTLQNKPIPLDEESDLNSIIVSQYKDCYACVLKIKEYMEKNYRVTVEEQEVVYLTIHIRRVIMDSLN